MLYLSRRTTGWLRSTLKAKYSTKAFQKYKQSCTDLRELPKTELRTFINCLKTVISDGDGVLWLNNQAIKGSADTFNTLSDFGKVTYICTNNSTRTRESLMKKANALGFRVSTNNIISSSHALAQYLKDLGFNKRVYVIGREGLVQELRNVGIKHLEIGEDNMKGTVTDLINSLKLEKDVGAVVIGFDEFFSFVKLTKACYYLMNPECLLLATNSDERYPAGPMILPATGCIVRAVEAAAERPALVVGKPNNEFCSNLLKNGSITPYTTLMVGDRGNTDILFGYNCGFYTLLVGSGTNSLQDVRMWRNSKDKQMLKLVPDFYLPKFGDFLEILNT